MNEPILENKKRASRKYKKSKALLQTPGYSVATKQEEKTMEFETVMIAPEMLPQNWEMIMDSMVELLDDVLYVEEKLVVKDAGFKSPTSEPIGESSIEKEIVKSSVKFGKIICPGKTTNLKNGDVIAFNGSAAKVIDFDKRFAIIQHFAIYGKIVRPELQQPTKPNRKDLRGWITQGFSKWMGKRNVHKSK